MSRRRGRPSRPRDAGRMSPLRFEGPPPPPPLPLPASGEGVHFAMSGHNLILEGLVTTLNPDRSVNISPMGPQVDREITRLCLRPYQTSRTYQNLKRHGEGVFHVTDDVELLARCAVGTLPSPPRLKPAVGIDGQIIADACRWYAFRVVDCDDSQERTRIGCEVVAHGSMRDFFGFNRAKHAVVEAAILATRIHLLQPDEVERQMRQLAVWVEKTGGEQEQRAFEFLKAYVDGHSDDSAERRGDSGA
ncbi:MAG TPA: DUF447 domain-containing protein [Gemmatimonadaceae bacterium]